MSQSTETIHIPKAISVNELAKKLNLSASAIITELMKNGVMANINEFIDFDTATIVGAELGFSIEPEEENQTSRPSQSDTQTNHEIKRVTRPPIVAVMGHVDHGKTSLLDSIRTTTVAASEAGGITQHIGAYQVKRNDRLITFLDTPGHEAFSAIRAHGAKMTDIAIIVVAADDGVKPQTKEAITHAQSEGAPLVIAINKIDKPGADVNRVKQELSEIGIMPDDWGGDVPCVEISAKEGTGIDKLLDIVLLVNDLNPPTALASGNARGLVIESHIESGRGPVVTLLVQDGLLKPGDYLIADNTYGKVKSLEDYRGKKIKLAGPATPAVILGLKSLPAFGDWFEVVETEKEAKDWVAKKNKQQTIKSLMRVRSASADDLHAAVADGKTKEFPIVLKADVAGSLESLTTSLEALGNEEVRVKIVSSGVGDISENDVSTAAASNATIVGFHVSISAAINQLAKREQVDFSLYRVIYELLDDAREQLSLLLSPEIIEHEIGKLTILAIFKQTREQIVTGGKVISGKITPSLAVHVVRKDKMIGDSKLISLQRNKESVKEVREGEECGIVLDHTIDIAVGDTIIFYSIEQKQRRL